MKKAILIISFIASYLTVFSQEYSTSIGIILNPNIASLYNIGVKNTTISRFSVSEGIEVKHRIYNDDLFIETGLILFDRGYRVDVQSYDNQGNKSHLYKIKEFDYYLMFPVSMIYQPKKFFVGAGTNINFYIKNKHLIDGHIVRIEKLYKSENILYGTQFFLGYETKISDKFLVSIEGFVNVTFNTDFINHGLCIDLKYGFS